MREVKLITTEELVKDLEDFLDWAHREGRVLYTYCGKSCSARSKTGFQKDGDLPIPDLEDVTLGTETATTRSHVVRVNEV